MWVNISERVAFGLFTNLNGMYLCLLNALAALGVTNGLPEIVKIGKLYKMPTISCILILKCMKNEELILTLKFRKGSAYIISSHISGGLFDESDQSESKQETAFR